MPYPISNFLLYIQAMIECMIRKVKKISLTNPTDTFYINAKYGQNSKQDINMAILQ